MHHPPILKKSPFLLLLVLGLGLFACQPNAAQEGEQTEASDTTEETGSDKNETEDTTPPNTLTQAEIEAGWELLFDGKTTDGWHKYNGDAVGASWQVVEGTLHLAADKQDGWRWQAEDGGDIVTDQEFENFELKLQWKISDCGNSGLMYLVQEGEQYDAPWRTGPEMQILDNTCHPDAKIPNHRAGSLYDLIEASPMTVKPAGEWNSVRVVLNEGRLEHWLNGAKVVQTTLWDAGWEHIINQSKFAEFPDFAKARSGKIALQDHNDAKLWFRNIKVRRL